MRVAQIAPLFESVPPTQYGGTERVVSYLTEELIRLGHEVTLFASGDSVTTAELVPCIDKSLRLHASRETGVVEHMLQLERVKKRAKDFDIIHFHTDYLHYPVLRHIGVPALTTLHGRQDLPEYVSLYDEFTETPVVSISNAQRAPLPWLNWLGTVHHGLPAGLYKFQRKSRGYAAFLGRIAVEKRPDRAIEIAKRIGIPLKIAAKVGATDKEYFDSKIRPLLDKGSDTEFIGEIGDNEKNDFLGNADVLLFPIDWPEPFGLVMIEAMACGTPVIAYQNGSVPEVITHGVSGFVVNSIDEAVRSAEKIPRLSRSAIRADFEKRFSVERMARDYLKVYLSLTDESDSRPFSRDRSLRCNSWKTSSSMPTTST